MYVNKYLCIQTHFIFYIKKKKKRAHTEMCSILSKELVKTRELFLYHLGSSNYYLGEGNDATASKA